MSVKSILSRKMGDLRWNQSCLAAATGIRPATIWALYHDMLERVSLEHIGLICEALNCSVSDILEYEPRKKINQEHPRHIAEAPERKLDAEIKETIQALRRLVDKLEIELS